MNRKLIIFLTLLCLLFLSSCDMPVSTCPPDLLTAPILEVPDMYEVVDTLTPTLSWDFSALRVYPFLYLGCLPDMFHVRLSTGPEFTDNLGGDVPGSSMSFTPTTPLEAGKQYAWGVYAISDGSPGPFAGMRYFFTGPMCATEDLIAPTLLWPPDGSVITAAEAEDTVDGPMPLLMWEYADPCLPEGYRIDLSTDPTFADTSLSGGTGRPSTRWMAGGPMLDCVRYYWKVAPINGTTLGPFSPTWSFDMAVGETCSPGFSPPPYDISRLPWWLLDVNANCRQGPGTNYPSVDNLPAGSSYPVDGRNADSTWFRILLSENRYCWLSYITGHFERGDADDVPTRRADPTPTPTATPPPTATSPPEVDCSQYTEPKSCMENPACEWIYNSPTGAYCANK